MKYDVRVAQNEADQQSSCSNGMEQDNIVGFAVSPMATVGERTDWR